MIVEQTVTIDQSVEDVYAAFKNPVRWQQVIPDVSDVRVLYDDGRHQEIIMTVEKIGGAESARSFRYCIENKILVYQPEPPPMLRQANGEWRIYEKDGMTCVHAIRKMKLKFNLDESAYSAFKQNVENHLLRNLNYFQIALEKP